MALIDDDDEPLAKAPTHKATTMTTGVSAMTEGINIQHHDHDYHPHGYSHGGAFGVGSILFFIAFIVIIGWIWGIGRRNEEHHERLTDKHHEGLRCMDKLGYEIGFRGKQLDDIQYDERAGFAAAQWRYDMNERFGVKYGDQTQRLCTAPPAHCGEHRGNRHGGVINGSQLSDTNTFAYDHSVL
ncbi:TPA: hypothetical protein PXM28_001482 [Yersinia enterocolitica]|nr:hypothetical protein [Yersinia enterocolitica]